MVGHVGDENGHLGGDGIQKLAGGVLALLQVVLVVADGHDDAVLADGAGGGELLQDGLDLGEGRALREIGIEQVLQRPGEVAVGIDEARQHASAVQVGLGGALGKGAGLAEVAHVGDGAVVIHQQGLGPLPGVAHGHKSGVGKEALHGALLS